MIFKTRMFRSGLACAAALGAALLGGCASAPEPAAPVEIAASPWATESAIPASPRQAGARGAWHHLNFPGKSPTRFDYRRQDGRHAIAALAQSSASMLRTSLRIEPQDLGSVRFSWKVPELIKGADLALRDAADSPVRVVLVFEGDRTRFSRRDAMLSELAHALTGEPLPYATLMYVWCNQRAPGAVIKSPRTERIRKLVVESGAGRLNQWLDYERNIRADFEQAFGEAPGALVGIGIMSDSDNTRSQTQAWYGAVRLGRPVLAER